MVSIDNELTMGKLSVITTLCSIVEDWETEGKQSAGYADIHNKRLGQGAIVRTSKYCDCK